MLKSVLDKEHTNEKSYIKEMKRELRLEISEEI